MSNRQPLPEIFARFAGVKIAHEDYEHESFSGRKFMLQRPTEEGKAQIKDIYQVAADNNVNLRLWTPNVMGTMDVQHSRLNIYVDSDWKIKNECRYG